MNDGQELQEIVCAQRRILDVLARLESENPDRPPTLGEMVADKVVKFVGSWPFVILQSVLLTLYIGANIWLAVNNRWDPYPFILLNLLLSFQAAFTAPLILIAQNRADAKDRHRALDAFKTVAHIEDMMENLHGKLERTKNGLNGQGDKGKSNSSEN